jgi:hypothetical protein
MKNFKFPVIALISLFAVFNSCEKDDTTEQIDDQSIEAKITAVWTGSEFYEDGQLSAFNDFFIMSSIEFKADGTGTSTIFLGSQPLTWSYDKTTERLRLETETVDLGDGITLEGSVIEGAEIIKLDASNLWFSYEDEGIEIEERYTK